jgi:putative ABC transport system ATP-binding protein
MLNINNLNVIFNENTIHEKQALADINLVVEDGDFITIIGSNGAGKSTLFNAVSGNVDVHSGKITIDDINITYMRDFKRSKFIGRLYQDPFQGTSPNMTIEENLGLAYSRGKKQTLSFAINKKDREHFKTILKELDLDLEKRLKTPVKLLSGGQRQALTLLMSTIVTPSLLLLDEHTAALDPKTSIQIMNLTKKIIERDNITTLMVTHNLEDAMKYGNKTIVMNNGKIVLILNQKQKKNMTIEELLKLYSSYSIELSDVNIFKEN